MFVVMATFMISASDEKESISQYEQKLKELQSIKEQIDQSQPSQQIFDALQTYGQCAGKIAGSVLAIMATRQSKQVCSGSVLSLYDKVNIVQAVVTGFLLLVEFARFCHDRKIHKKMVHTMNYQDFVMTYPHLVLVEYHILLMKTLINLSVQGTFPEQVFARIQLTKMSLPIPFAKFAHKSAKKMYQLCFDVFGNFVWSDLKISCHPYKKFFKKVPQDFRQIALKAYAFQDIIQLEYLSDFANLIDTPYNNTLIKIINAGMHGDVLQLQLVAQAYLQDTIVQRLASWYGVILR